MAGDDMEWSFYGRAKELHELKNWYLTPTFSTISIVGGRGVGKTELTRAAAKSLKGRKPYIFAELPAFVPGDAEAKRLRGITDLNGALRDGAVGEGLGDVLRPHSRSSDYVDQMRYFKSSLEVLLKSGAVVVLDEFQNSDELIVLNGVKSLIDDLNFERSSAGGKIVLVGSHQQKMLKMLFRQTEPMYGRVDFPMRLFPLSAPDVFQMAAAQGWLHRPYRFLTAYAAFGGNPRSWRRFAQEIKANMLPEPDNNDDTMWRQNFVIREIKRIISDRDEQFLNNAYTNFSEAARRVAVELARNPRGVRWSQIVQQCGGGSEQGAEEMERGFRILQRHLGIAEFVPENDLFPPSVKKARLVDQTALFELHMAKHWKNLKADELKEHGDAVLSRISKIEGMAFERLTAEWLQSFGLFSFVRRSMEMRRPEGGQLEIDIIAQSGRTPQNESQLALCSCKRNPRKHQLVKTRDDFDLYLRLQEERGVKWDRVRRFLVSPEWPESGFRNDGFRRLSCRSMAHNLGFKIRPWPAQAPPAPAPEASGPRADTSAQHGEPASLDHSGGPEFGM